MSNPSDPFRVETALATFTKIPSELPMYAMTTDFNGTPVTVSNGFLGGVKSNMFDNIESIASTPGRVSFRLRPELDTPEAADAVVEQFLQELDLRCSRFGNPSKLDQFRGGVAIDAMAMSARASGGLSKGR